MENELIQYFIVNKDLINDYGMSTGKIAAQVSHACMLIALRDQNDENFQQWMNSVMKKIILKGFEKDLVKLIEQGFLPIYDKGLTEIPENSLTCVGLPVMTRKDAKKYIKRFQLL